MRATKNDLSGNEVTLDYIAMRNTSRAAVYLLLERVSDYHSEIRNRMNEGIDQKHSTGLQADWLLSNAKSLVEACETYDALNCGLERDNVKIVNKIKEAQT